MKLKIAVRLFLNNGAGKIIKGQLIFAKSLVSLKALVINFLKEFEP